MIQRNVNIRNLDLIGAFDQVYQEIFEAMTENGGQNNGTVREVQNWMRGRDQRTLETALGTGADTARGQQHPPGSDLGQEPDSLILRGLPDC